MEKIDNQLLDALTTQAKNSPRLRMNHNFHTDLCSTLQRMLNAIEPGSYIRPHRHVNPDKAECYMVVRGTILALTFDDKGAIIDRTTAGPGHTVYGVDIEAGVWHTLVALESGTVIFEAKAGPYTPADESTFASWAPAENSKELEAFMKQLTELASNPFIKEK